MINSEVVIIGGGGHSSSVTEVILNLNYSIIAIVAKEKKLSRVIFEGIQVVNDDFFLRSNNLKSKALVNGLGFMPASTTRKDMFISLKKLGLSFETIISPEAIVSKYAFIEEGVQIMPGAIVQAGAHIGHNTIINTGCIIEHDTKVGAHCHVAPGAVICGGVNCSDDIFVGANATIIQGLSIKKNCVIGAGAVVRKNLKSGITYF